MGLDLEWLDFQVLAVVTDWEEGTEEEPRVRKIHPHDGDLLAHAEPESSGTIVITTYTAFAKRMMDAHGIGKVKVKYKRKVAATKKEGVNVMEAEEEEYWNWDSRITYICYGGK